MIRQTVFVGSGLVGAGLLAILVGALTFPDMLFAACTEGAPGDGPPAVLGVEGSQMVYTPDGGANTCQISMVVATVPPLLVLLGVLVLVGGFLTNR
jgi:hypothetical protein